MLITKKRKSFLETKPIIEVPSPYIKELLDETIKKLKQELSIEEQRDLMEIVDKLKKFCYNPFTKEVYDFDNKEYMILYYKGEVLFSSLRNELIKKFGKNYPLEYDLFVGRMLERNGYFVHS